MKSFPSRIRPWLLGSALFASAAAMSAMPSAAVAADAFPMLLSTPAAGSSTRAAKAVGTDKSVARQRAVAVRLEHLDPDAGALPARIGVELFDGNVVLLDVNRVERRASGDFTWYGRVEGQDRSQAVLTVIDGKIAGTITLSDSEARINEQYQLLSERDGSQSLRRINQDGFPSDHPPGFEALHEHSRSLSLGGGASVGAKGADRELRSSTAAADTGATVDVMVVYSKQTAAAAGTAIAAQIQQAIDSANLAYANSGINTRLNLVHIEALNYDESGDFNTDLNRLTTAGDGYMDDVPALRNTYAADLVSLFVENGQYCGLAWVGPSAGYGFSVINRGCASGNLSFAHELGHNFGALHDPYVDPSTSPYAYGHGYAVPAAGWRTVMAYNNACTAAGTSCTRIPYFSNPSLTYGSPGLPLGSTSTSDNARVHNLNAATVANFRSSGAGGCTYALAPATAAAGAASTSATVAVTAGTGCVWNTLSNASWLAVATSSAKSGTGSLNYTVAANTGPARSGTITVGNASLTVNQATGCTYTLSSGSASLSAAGGSGSFTLTTSTGCAWTASSSASWLSVSSGTSGTGSVTVSYAAAANTGALRSGNLVVGGKTFVVTESAATTAPAAPIATLSATSISFGNQKVGTTSAAKSVTLTNTGGGTLTIASLTAGGANPTEFARSGTCAVGAVLVAGRSCTFQYTFKPTVASSRSATLTVGTGAGSATLTLTGRGARK